jgi:AraC-like DNA-binding protein
LGDSKMTIEIAMKAADLAKAEQAFDLMAECNIVLARAYADLEEFSKASDLVNLAEQQAMQSQNWYILLRTYNMAGNIQFGKKNFDSALLFYNKSLFIAEKHSTPRVYLANIYSNIGKCYAKTGGSAAFKYFNKSLQLAKQTGNKVAEAATLGSMGHAMIKQKKFDQAEKYLTSGLQLSLNLGLKRITRYVYSGLISVKEAQGNLSLVIDYLGKYHALNEQLLNTAKTRQIVELEARYEMEKKEQSIILLQKEKQIDAMWKDILIAIVGLLSFVPAVYYYSMRFREKKNREILNLEIDNLTTQNKEIAAKHQSVLIHGEPIKLEKPIESQTQRLLKRAIEIVENNIADPLFGVERMSQEMGMSRTNMHRKIKVITGFPPSELIRSIRLRKAALLLVNQADSVSQISLMVGFEDHSYFSKSFKKYFGVVPSEYLSSLGENITDELKASELIGTRDKLVGRVIDSSLTPVLR